PSLGVSASSRSPFAVARTCDAGAAQRMPSPGGVFRFAGAALSCFAALAVSLAAVCATAQRFSTPGAGSPNTPLLHAALVENVLTTCCSTVPYNTSRVPLNWHVPYSAAQGVHFLPSAVMSALPAPLATGNVVPAARHWAAVEPNRMKAAAVTDATCNPQLRVVRLVAKVRSAHC